MKEGEAMAIGPFDEPHPGCQVEVRNHLLATWAAGFQVAIRTPAGYILRRNSDQALLPETLYDNEVRRLTPAPMD
jgi:hypothetical protein